MKKTLPIIIVLLIVAGAYFLYSNKSTNAIYDLLIDLGDQTEMEFSDPVEGMFEWRIEDSEPINLVGWEINAEDVPIEGIYGVPLFEANGFEMDIYNMADGTLGSLSGFTRGEVACTFYDIFSGEVDEDGLPIDPFLSDVKISCGILK